MTEPAGPLYRAAVAADFDAIAAVWHESARRAAGAPSDMPSPAELRRRIDREIAEGWVVTVALQAGQVVGFLALKPRAARLDQLFVLPSAQGIGIGRALIEQAKNALPGGFTLRTASANLAAGRFYRRMGLSPVGEGVHPDHGHAVSHYAWPGA